MSVNKLSTEELADKLVSWLREVAASASSKGVVFGMSGGVDSSVVAVLCKRAFSQNCLGVIMPCHSSESDRKHAELVAKKFHIPIVVVELDQVFDALVAALPSLEVSSESLVRLALANVKPRLRMTTLYYFANCLGYLVIGSSNRAELNVGYFTKYGDGGVDVMPLGNLVKGQVRDLARYLGIPKEIIDKPPSAGLWEGQTDEEEMGLTYEQLDRYLMNGQAEVDVKSRIDSMIARSAHKRRLPLLPPF